MDNRTHLPRWLKGITLLVMGTILLLYILGILQEATGIIIFFLACCMLAFGFFLVGGPKCVKTLYSKLSEWKNRQ